MSKFRTLEHFKKLFPDTNCITEIPDMLGKFRTYATSDVPETILSGVESESQALPVRDI